jgi:hypothetical protein
MFSRRIKLTPPAGITAVQLAADPFSAGSTRKFALSWLQGKQFAAAGETAIIPAGVELEIREVDPAVPVAAADRPAYKSTFVCLRRLASETRDRLRI